MTGLDGLPVELLYHISLYALNPSLPLISRHLSAVYHSTSPTFRAQYLLQCHSFPDELPPGTRLALTVQQSLRHPICDVPVIQAIHRLYRLPDSGRLHPTSTPLIELPKRLFRRRLVDSPDRSSTIMPPIIISTLQELDSHCDVYRVDPNSHRGYALTMACHSGDHQLVKLLLAKGADPNLKDALAVLVAIRRRDLALVKLLVERHVSDEPATSTSSVTSTTSILQLGTTSNKTDDSEYHSSPRIKRRRLEDRVQITPRFVGEAVKADARNIVDYFVHVKGCSPDLKTLEQLIRRGKKGR